MFLRGRRRLDIQPAEIVTTRLYQRSSEAERRAILMVCETEHEIQPPPEDERELRSRDAWLMDFVDGRNLGHADRVAQITAIPVHVAERQKFDRTYFKTMYKSPRLFSFLWNKG
jgi:hypothetical protein